jgi:glycerol-3-phosphate acyltransferase PlsX
MKIGVDAMGSDHAPKAEVEGAVQVVQELGHDVVLVGDETIIKDELKKYKWPSGKISVVHAPERIAMHEAAAISVRRKRHSSIVVGLELVKNKETDGFVSAGNTGAVVCAAVISLRLLTGIERPGIAVVYPTLTGIAVIIDVGANISPEPIHILQYGIMADAYCKYILHKANPTVGLINVGEGKSKGTELVKEAHILLSESKLNFVGNIEGREVHSGKVDIVLCDGFTGNIIVKISETVADTILKALKQEIKSNFLATLGAILITPAFKKIKKNLDPSDHGGAPLLGIDGTCIISHGSSDARAIKNAVKVAAEFTRQELNKHISEELVNY